MAKMFDIDMKLDGAKELEAALRALPGTLAKGVLQRALVKAARPMVDDAKSRVRRRTGRLASKINVSTQLSRRQKRGRAREKGLAEAFVGASPARHAHLVELGSGPRHHKSGKYVGQMPASPFLRPAFEANAQGLIDALGEEIWRELEKSATRLGRKAAKFKA
jgi:HK97 gp10 family phage protein